jgi:hypothetical protein
MIAAADWGGWSAFGGQRPPFGVQLTGIDMIDLARACKRAYLRKQV